MGMYLIKDTYKMLQAVWRQREGKPMNEVVYSRQAIETQWYRRLYHRQLYVNAAVVMICVLLSAYIAVYKHDPVPVQHAAVSAEEYQAVVQLERQAQTEKATLRKQLADEHARRLLGDKMIKSLNATVAQHQQHLKDLQVSVPAQPIILEAIRKEASTEKGLRQAVDRAFGNGIGARIKVVNE